MHLNLPGRNNQVRICYVTVIIENCNVINTLYNVTVQNNI